MLGKLFGSQARVKILKLFLLHPQERFYIRQLARDLKLQVNSVRRELDNLEKLGLLVSYASRGEKEEGGGDDKGKLIKIKNKKQKDQPNKQEKKYYQVNLDFVLFEEIKALIVKAQVLYEKDFINKLESAGVAKLLILTGFFVNVVTPIDLLVVGKMNKVKLFKLIAELEKELGREINYTYMDTREFKYRRDITDVFLYEILESKKIVVIDEMNN